MNLRTPEQLITKLNEQRQVIHDAIVKQISAKLEADFSGYTVDVSVDYSYGQINLVLPQLKTTLKEYNWNIEVGETNTYRNEVSTTLRISPIKPDANDHYNK